MAIGPDPPIDRAKDERVSAGIPRHHDPEIPEEIMNWLGGCWRWNIEGAATVSGLAASQVLAQLEPLRHMRLSHDGTYEKD
jgi:hypothetical protein